MHGRYQGQAVHTSVQQVVVQMETGVTLHTRTTLRADGVCESVLYGLPLVLRPTTCWQLDWDEMETNHNLFHALCHTLRSRDLFLLLRVEAAQRPPAGGSGVCSHYVLQPSPSLSLLLKPVVSRELLLPCSLPVSTQEPAADAVLTVQGCLTQLDEECVFNPLSLSSNLYQHLRSRGLLSQPRYPYRLQPAAAHRDQAQPLEGPKATGSRQRQPQSHGRQLGMNSKARATVAPLPSSSSHSSSSSLGPPPVKASRPALKLLSSSGGRRAPAPTRQEEDNGDDDDSMGMQRRLPTDILPASSPSAASPRLATFLVRHPGVNVCELRSYSCPDFLLCSHCTGDFWTAEESDSPSVSRSGVSGVHRLLPAIVLSGTSRDSDGEGTLAGGEEPLSPEQSAPRTERGSASLGRKWGGEVSRVHEDLNPNLSDRYLNVPDAKRSRKIWEYDWPMSTRQES
ncbi:Meiosis 1 arrest protein [Liparis tanakae]|uniref:Meiosis 1 arrest protein n=1 Tax=Liparis tanakae TaxID=230148 RepID=A0A4Z2J5R4_9TELE|nr:Meiosis 1 arrest protein [Liparis tanakae]